MMQSVPSSKLALIPNGIYFFHFGNCFLITLYIAYSTFISNLFLAYTPNGVYTAEV